jgi:hypothetical protein
MVNSKRSRNDDDDDDDDDDVWRVNSTTTSEHSMLVLALQYNGLSDNFLSLSRGN